MSGPASSSDQILLTKIQVPRLRPQRVERPRLVDRLEQGAWGRLTLVCAPAGFGKTTLLASWARLCTRPVAWLALDEGDNIPVRFFTYLAAALDRVLPGAGEPALAALRTPQPVQPEALIASLINAVAERAQPAVLVLDDYHLIQSAPIHAAVGYLVDHLPDGLHLVIAGRADPPLSLARLRARSELNELRGPELRFNTQETADFLNQVMGLSLTAAEVEALEARTEGWIAGLQLAALSMQDRKDVDRFIKVFTGSHRYILDYLVEEVLRRQPEEIQEFLLQTSILERLCASLCEAVVEGGESRLESRKSGGDASRLRIERSDESRFSIHDSRSSQSLLETLDRSNLFIIPLDDERRWFRYHTLFADLLRYRLEQAHPDRVEDLHRRAAGWYQANGLPVESVSHWLAAKDWGRAALQVRSAGEDMLNHGRGISLVGWLDRLPAAVFEALPRLHMMYTWGLMQTSQFEEIEPRLQEAEKIILAWPPDLALPVDQESASIQLGEIAATRALLASIGGDLPRMIQLSEQALAQMPDSYPMRCTVLLGLGVARLLAGETRSAEQAFAEAARLAHQTGQLAVAVTALANHGDTWMILGNLNRAEQAYSQALSLVPPEDHRSLPVISMGHAGLASVQREKGELTLAREHIQKALDLDELWGNRDIHTINQARLAQILFSCGDTAGGWQALDAALEKAREQQLTPTAHAALISIYIWACLAYGRREAAWQWALEHPAGPVAGFLGELPALTWAEVLISRGHSESEPALLQPARERLESLIPGLGESGRDGFHLIASLLLALACSGLGQDEAAFAALEEALELAADQGYQSVFLDRGPALGALLARWQPRSRHPERIKVLLAAFARSAQRLPQADPAQPVRPASPPAETGNSGLTAREIEVLRLVAQGLSNPQVAERLVVSPGTVKRHLHNIFEKLDVTTRSQAIASARQLGLD